MQPGHIILFLLPSGCLCRGGDVLIVGSISSSIWRRLLEQLALAFVPRLNMDLLLTSHVATDAEF